MDDNYKKDAIKYLMAGMSRAKKGVIIHPHCKPLYDKLERFRISEPSAREMFENQRIRKMVNEVFDHE